MRNRQQGIALVTVLLILSLATLAAVAMTARQQLDIRRTSNILQLEQAYAAMQSYEELAKKLLLMDDNSTDSMTDIWATFTKDESWRALNIAGFQLQEVMVEDLHGRFNINNLLDASGQVSTVNRERFERLLQNYALPVELARTAVDWLDDNLDVTPAGGAEDSDYLLDVNNSYITPRGPMASSSEMNRLLGVNLSLKQDTDGIALNRRREIWKMIFQDKVLVALPQGSNGTNINVNTVTHPYIYRMIVPDMEEQTAIDLFERVRGNEETKKTPSPFEKVSVFLQAAGVSGSAANSINTQLSVTSEYFLFRAVADNAEITVYLNTILRRIGSGSSATVQVVHRSYGKLGEI